MTGPVEGGAELFAAAGARQTNAPSPVMARPTISVLISRVPS